MDLEEVGTQAIEHLGFKEAAKFLKKNKKKFGIKEVYYGKSEPMGKLYFSGAVDPNDWGNNSKD